MRNGPVHCRVGKGWFASWQWLLAMVWLLAGASAGAQPRDTAGYPQHPVHVVVPFAPGGPTDILARALAQKFALQMGQPVVVENRPGAGGTIGATAVARAAPDGYTLLMATSSTHSIGPLLNPRLPYDAVADFTPVVAVASAPGLMLVPAGSPARTLQDFIAMAGAHPGRLSYGSSGSGTIVHVAMELFKADTGTFIVHIPYRGTSAAMSDLMANQVDLVLDSLMSGLPAVRDGRVRALAVTSARRSALAPDVPAVSEVLPGFEAVTWFGLYGPRSLPPEITLRLNQAVNAALADTQLGQQFAQLGAEPIGGTPQAFVDLVRLDVARYRRLIASRHIGSE